MRTNTFLFVALATTISAFCPSCAQVCAQAQSGTRSLGQATSAKAQTTSLDSTGSPTIELNPVTITGTGTYRKASNAPIAVKVITAKDIENIGATSLQDALTRLTTNVTTHTNGMGTFLNFNGVSDDYILIMENGKPVIGEDRWNRINMHNVKRIEIVSGAASALYGSEAIAGVINIITEAPLTPKGGVLNTSPNAKIGASSYTKGMSNGRFDQAANVDISVGKFSSYTSFEYKHADNWQVNKYQEFMETQKDAEGNKQDVTVLKLNGRPMSQGFRSYNVSDKMDWRFNDKWSVYLRGNYYDYLSQRPQNAMAYSQKGKAGNYTIGDAKLAYTYDIGHKSYMYGGGARWAPNNNVHIYLDVYSDNYVTKYNYWQTATTEDSVVTRQTNHYTNETLKGIFRLNDRNKLSAGLEFIQSGLSSVSDGIDYETTYTYNFFAQDEIKITKWLEGVAGVRYTYNNNFGSAVTPNAALFAHWGGFRIRASYAGGYRTPTLAQLYATDQAKTTKRYTLNNTGLKPEKNDFWNANVEYSNKWMTVSVTGFINKIRDMINYRTLTQEEIDANPELAYLQSEAGGGWETIRQRDNIDKATIYGISTNVKLLLPHDFTIGGGYTYIDSKAETATLNTKTQEYEIAESPVDKTVRSVGNVNVAWDHTWLVSSSNPWKKYHLNIFLNGHIQGQRYSSTYGYAEGYSQWDISTRHTITFKQFILEPGIGIENIFNQTDDSYWTSNFSTVNPGRSLYISLALKFKD